MTFKHLGVAPQLISKHPNSETAGKCFKCNTFFGGDDSCGVGEPCPHCSYDHFRGTLTEFEEELGEVVGWANSFVFEVDTGHYRKAAERMKALVEEVKLIRKELRVSAGEKQ